jgi:hypothetical protein
MMMMMIKSTCIMYSAGLHSIECSLRIKKEGGTKNSNDRIEKGKRRQLGAWHVQKQQLSWL